MFRFDGLKAYKFLRPWSIVVKISFITFTKNSEDRIGRLLNHVKDIVDEIIVVDGCSTDRTVEIAKTFGAKVYTRRSWGYPDPDRMFAVKKTSYEWVLHLDDDERLCSKLKMNFRKIIEYAAKQNFSAISITRITLTSHGKPILGPMYPDVQIRIFKKDSVDFKGLVHEPVRIRGKVLHLPEEYYILHFPKFTKGKTVLYAKLEALEYYDRYESSSMSLVNKALLKLAPITCIPLALYYLVLHMRRRKPLNYLGVVEAFDLAKYQSMVNLLMASRNRKQKLMAKIIQERGLTPLIDKNFSRENLLTKATKQEYEV